MDITTLVCLLFLYIVCVWVLIFNVLSDDRFSVLEKRLTIVFLFLLPIGFFLLVLFKIMNRKKKVVKNINKNRPIVYHGGYHGGHNKPKNNN